MNGARTTCERACVASVLVVAVFACSALAQTPEAASAPQPVAPPVASAEPVRSLDCVVSCGPTTPMAAVAWSPDGKLVAAGGYQEVLIWDVANGALLKRLGTGQLADTISAVVFSADGSLLAVAEGVPYGAGAVKLLDVAAGGVIAAFLEPQDATLCLTLSPDGKWLAGAGVDGVVRVWSMDEKKLAGEMRGHAGWVRGVAFSADGKLLASAGRDRVAIVWEVGTWNRLSELRENDPLLGVAFSPDAQFLILAVAGVNDKVLRWRRRDNGQVVRDVNLIQTVPLDVVWNASSNRVYVPCSDKTAKVYDGGNGGQVVNCAGETKGIYGLIEITAGRQTVVANNAGHGDWVYRVAASADGTKLATAGADGKVKLWSAADGRLLATLLQLTPRTDEWIVLTTAGYLATSSPAALQWRVTGFTMPPEQVSALLLNAELVKQVLAGGAVTAPSIQ
ncbi:MAG: WD40 repeat domain-containing protein [Pirellulaceae bacterium]